MFRDRIHSMLDIDLGKIFGFIPQTGMDPSRSVEDLLGKIDPKDMRISDDTYKGLIGEWILFEYKEDDKPSLLVQYLMRNPDNLSETELGRIEQIVKSQTLMLFQTYKPAKPPYLFLRSVYSGKTYKVYDKLLSASAGLDEISLWGRLSKVDGVNYLIGSNPISLPIRYTDRMIKIFADQKVPLFTLRDVIKSFVRPEVKKPKVVDINKERKRLEVRYAIITAKYRCKVTHGDIVKFIYNERYNHNFGDYFEDLMKLGVPEEMCFENIKFFQEVWNYLPHKILGDKSPYECGKKMGLTDVG